MRALITGAAEGLGRAIAEKIVADGGHVVGLDVNGAQLHQLGHNRGDNFDAMAVDLADHQAVEKSLSELGDLGPFDLVIFNAGVSATGKFEDIPAAAYQRLLAINLVAPLVMASQLMAAERINRNGTMVFISSLSHVTGYPGASVYGASKDAIAAYANSIRPACRRSNINVLTVFPGPVETAHAERHAPSGSDTSKRMPPVELARRILVAVAGGKSTLYPGSAAMLARLFGRVMPATMTRIMRRMIFEKLDGPVY